MTFIFHIIISLICLTTIVLSCVLFTNAIEFLGNKLNFGKNATGSILAVIGTGLPEAIVPIIAIFGSIFISKDLSVGYEIALGAMFGSPFMLTTLALFILGTTALSILKKQTLNASLGNILRNYKYLAIAYCIAIFASFELIKNYKLILAILLVILYFIYAYRTIILSKNTEEDNKCEKLIFNQNNNLALFLQISISLLLLAISTYYFIEEIKFFSNIINIHPIILSLIITPFATELPEIINSIIWIKQKKDELAIANITGATIFQTTILFALGIILTPWNLTKLIYFNCSLLLIFTIIFTLNLKITKSIQSKILISLLIPYILYFAYIFMAK